MQMNSKIVKNVAAAIMDDVKIKYLTILEEYLASEAFQLRVSNILLTDESIQNRKKNLEYAEKMYKFLLGFENTDNIYFSVYLNGIPIDRDLLQNEELFYNEVEKENEYILHRAKSIAKEQIGLQPYRDYDNGDKLAYIERKVVALVSTMDEPSYQTALDAVMAQIDILSIIVNPKI